MTASPTTNRPTLAPAGATPQTPGRSGALRVAGGAALVAGPVLFALGMITCPPQASMSDADYVASLARDTTLTQVSALFLHYANVALGLGLLAAPSLVRGARGRIPTVVGALLGALGFVNVSGQLLSDWWNMSAGRLLPLDQAAAVFAGMKSASLMPFWDATEVLSLLGPILVLVGLARAGVLGWWTIAVLVGGVAGLMFIPVQMTVLVAAAVLVGFSPFAMIGLRLLQRHRAGVE
jgi:hypothetical protein